MQAAASEPRPDLILLDVMMPEMDGYEVLRHLHANPTTNAIPVIFVTASDSSDDEEQGLTLGAVDYITKPIRPAVVIARVQAHLALKASRDLLQRTLDEEIDRRMADNLRIQEAVSYTHLDVYKRQRSSRRACPAATDRAGNGCST